MTVDTLSRVAAIVVLASFSLACSFLCKSVAPSLRVWVLAIDSPLRPSACGWLLLEFGFGAVLDLSLPTQVVP